MRSLLAMLRASERPPNDPPLPQRGKLGHTGWVIIKPSLSGRPIAWVGYHRSDVWRWYTNPAKAEVFDTKQSASEAAENCSVSYQCRYAIHNLNY